ncbi:MAG: hypothetical protein EXR99_00090 [Gemmataceae bacterium]|nr:hypothetical protein [Gemmataceae bacterium]
MKQTIASLFLLFLAGLGSNPGWSQESQVKLFALQVNSPADEDDPHFAPSVNALLTSRFYFSRQEGKGKPVIMVSKWEKKANKWGEAFTIGPYIDSKAGDASCFVGEEGKFPQLIIYATRKDEKNSNFDLYKTFRDGPGKDREDKAFMPARPLISLDTDEDEMYPWLSKDQMQIFFSRKGKDGWRLWTARREAGSGVEGNFAEPNLLNEIPPGFHHVTMNPLGTLMFLQGPVENNRTGIFQAKKTGAKWGDIKPVETLNHPEGKIGSKSPNLSRDGLRLYFASDRPGGQGGLDLYSILVSDLKLTKTN